MLHKATRLILALFISGYAFIEFFSHPSYSGQLAIAPSPSIDVVDDPMTVPLMLYNEAFLDYRFRTPRIRLFSFNPCLPKNFSINTFINGEKKELYGTPLEASCPWKVDEQCVFNAHTFSLPVPKEFDETEITLHNSVSNITLPMRKIKRKTKQGLTICVQPVYFYTEFHKIIIFMESWLSQGATKFIVYFHSATPEVMRVLRHYEEKKIAEIVQWSDFPALRSKYNRYFPQPNESIYRFGHLQAQNLCALKSETDVTAIVDFDEVIAIRNMTTLDFASYTFKKVPKVGAVYFNHQNIRFNPSLVSVEKVTFGGVSSIQLLPNSGPNKYIFQTDAVEIASTHGVYKFIDRKYIKKTLGRNLGILYHHRYNNEFSSTAVIGSASIPLMYGFNATEAEKRLTDKMKEIFHEAVPPMNYNATTQLAACIAKLKASKTRCRATGAYCLAGQQLIRPWTFSNATNLFQFL